MQMDAGSRGSGGDIESDAGVTDCYGLGCEGDSMNRQIRRLERCIDELIKIHDDGKGSEYTFHMLDDLNAEITRRESDD